MTKISFSDSLYKQSLNKYAPILVLGLCCVSLLLLPFRPDVTSKIFNFTGIISILVTFISPKFYIKNNIFFIFITLFTLGLTHLLWVELYKTSESIYRNVYHGYFQMGKIAIFGSFILLLTSKILNNQTIDRLHFIIAIISQLGIFGYTLYQKFHLNIQRVELAFGNASNATGAAYAMIFFSIYAQSIFLRMQSKLKYYLYTVSILLTFICLIFTETRAGILLYPVVTLFIFFRYAKQNKNINIKFSLIPLAITLVICVGLNQILIQRMQSAIDEVTTYIQNGGTSSVGDRLSMIKTGYYSSNDFLWQSAEERNSKIIELAKNDKRFAGATQHMHAHLHNDLMEELSTKGWINGVLLILLFYVAILVYGYKQAKNPFILGFALALMGLGLSDTLIISTQVSLSWMLVLILMTSCFSSRLKHS